LFFPISTAGKCLEQVAEAKQGLRPLPGAGEMPDFRPADRPGARDLGWPDRGRAHPGGAVEASGNPAAACCATAAGLQRARPSRQNSGSSSGAGAATKLRPGPRPREDRPQDRLSGPGTCLLPAVRRRSGANAVEIAQGLVIECHVLGGEVLMQVREGGGARNKQHVGGQLQ
jgi:hypothetical protein